MKKSFFFKSLVLVVLLSSCRPIVYNVPNVTDYKIFNTQLIEKSSKPIQIPRSSKSSTLPDEFLWAISNDDDKVYNYKTPEDFLISQGTLSFIVIKNDTIVYEKYFNGFEPDSIRTIFSVSKAFTSTLVGIAINEGYIKSVDQLVSDFIPSFKSKGKEEMTINNLLQMTSGLSENDYNDILKIGFFYYSKDQNRRAEKTKLRYKPGTKFQYSSITTQLLGICLEKATGKPFETYFKEKIWEPMGMEYNALSSRDDKGFHKYFGGISANPKDLAKFGLLYLKKGNWNGQQIVPEEWVKATAKRDTIQGKSTSYTNCFWLDTYPIENKFNKSDLFAGGYGGQIVYVNPENNTVIIRTGTTEVDVHWGRSFSKLSHFPLNKVVDSQELYNSKLIGTYKNKFGKEIYIYDEAGRVIMKCNGENFECHLVPSSDVTFEDKKHGRKVLVEFDKDKIKGVILEEGKNSFYFSKR
jgi:CubicO group peptidase (beta-lactamase class C family)